MARLAVASAALLAAAAVVVFAVALQSTAAQSTPLEVASLLGLLAQNCPSGSVINVAQASLGTPKTSSPRTPPEAIAVFARVTELRLPAGVYLRTAMDPSDGSGAVLSTTVAGHVIRHGNHWRADYLGVCQPPPPLLRIPLLRIFVPTDHPTVLSPALPRKPTTVASGE